MKLFAFGTQTQRRFVDTAGVTLNNRRVVVLCATNIRQTAAIAPTGASKRHAIPTYVRKTEALNDKRERELATHLAP